MSKDRGGARVHRVYDRAQTPYQRLCAAGVLAPAAREDSRRSISASTRSSSAATSTPRSSGSGPSPRPIRTAQGNTETAPPSPKSSPRRSQTMASVTLNYELTRTGG